MPQFSRSSRINLLGCHHDLQRIFVAVGRSYRLEVLRGYRNLQMEPGVRPGMAVDIRVLELDPDDPAVCDRVVKDIQALADALYDRGIVFHRLIGTSCSVSEGEVLVHCRLG